MIVYLNPKYSYRGHNTTLYIKKTEEKITFFASSPIKEVFTYFYDKPYNASNSKGFGNQFIIESEENYPLHFKREEFLTEKEYHDKSFDKKMDKLLK